MPLEVEALEPEEAEEAPGPVPVGAGVDDVCVAYEDEYVSADEYDSGRADDICMNASYTEHQDEVVVGSNEASL